MGYNSDGDKVGYNSDGDKIVSGGQDGTLKVWGVRPFLDSEWEEVDISEIRLVDGLGYVVSNYWRNKVTGDLRPEYCTAGARLDPRTDQSLGCRC